jgi:hypothetical protein
MTKKVETAADVEIETVPTSKRNRILFSKEVAYLLLKEKQFERNLKMKKKSI